MKRFILFNVGNREAVTSKEWVEACAVAAGKKADIMEIDYAELDKNVRDFYPFFDYDNVLEVSKMSGNQFRRRTQEVLRMVYGKQRKYCV